MENNGGTVHIIQRLMEEEETNLRLRKEIEELKEQNRSLLAKIETLTESVRLIGIEKGAIC